MKKEKIWISSFLIIVFLLCSIIIYLNYKIDPYQQYSFNSPTNEYIEDRAMYIQRHLTPGFARNLNYDTILVGSSMSETLKVSSIDRELNTKSAKLSISGGTPYEIKNVLNTAISTGKVKTALVSVDLYMYNNEVDFRREPYPSHLYDDNKFNDLKYLLNSKIFSEESFKLYKSRKSGDIAYDMDKLYKDKDSTVYSYDTVIPKYDLPLYSETSKNAKEDMTYILSDDIKETKSFKTMKNNFISNLLNVAQNNPTVDFKVYFPPYSILMFNTQSDSDSHTLLLAFKKYMYEELSKLSNVEVYDFQDVSSITHNFSYYKDTSHFSAEVGDIILRFMANKKHILTNDNYIAKIENLLNQLEGLNYDTLKDMSK
ncbi:MAG: hypothetical protein ACRC7N_05800 [Clostridium sp.]